MANLPSFQDTLVNFIQMTFYLALLIIYIDAQSIRDAYGKGKVETATRKASEKLWPAVTILSALSAFSFAVGHAFALLHLRLVSVLLLAMAVSCALFYLSAKGLAVYGYMVALVAPLLSLALLPSTDALSVSLFLTLPMTVNVLIYWRLMRTQMKAMKLPSVQQILARGLRFRIYPPAVLLSGVLLSLYLGIVLPDFYTMGMTDRVLLLSNALEYCFVSVLSPLVAAGIFYLYFIFFLGLFVNVDLALMVPLYVILALPIATMRRVKMPPPLNQSKSKISGRAVKRTEGRGRPTHIA